MDEPKLDDSARQALRARFEKNLLVTPGCWLIPTRKSKYPCMPVLGKQWSMSRVSYELYVGPTEGVIKRGVLAICHRCDNPKCVNPDHLFIGTYYDNMADMVNKGRARPNRGTQVNTAKLDENRVRLILNDPRVQTRIAADYGVDQSVISDIKARKIWRHVNV